MLADIKIHQTAKSNSATTLVVDGVDLAGATRSYAITSGPPDYLAIVGLEMVAQLVDFEGRGEVKLWVPPEVEAAMLAAGWTKPQGDTK